MGRVFGTHKEKKKILREFTGKLLATPVRIKILNQNKERLNCHWKKP